MEALVRSIAAGLVAGLEPLRLVGSAAARPIANNQVFYPPTWLNLVMQPWSYYTLYVPAHFLFSGWGLYLLCSRLGASRFAATLGGAHLDRVRPVRLPGEPLEPSRGRGLDPLERLGRGSDHGPLAPV